MKKILITGKNSYIGTSFESYMKDFNNDYVIDTIDMVGDSWKTKDFSKYDVVFHVAGIAHSDTGKISAERELMYRSVNTDLAIETAQKAKADMVKQFIFMSSSIVYGDSAPLGKSKIITRETPVSPANCYGDSKVQAEIGLRLLEDNNFGVVILRPPMIYGKFSKGNYPILAKIAKKIPVFPKVQNARSMLYIEHLLSFVKLMIDNDERGIFWPQNKEYVNTSELVNIIANTNGRSIRLTRAFNWILQVVRVFSPLVDKAFGSLVYAKELSEYKHEYRQYSLEDSIRKTEK